MKTAVVSPNLSVSYDEAGRGTPLVLLHAFPLSSQMWEKQQAAFASNFRVLSPNFRGVDGTSKFDGEPFIQTLAHDVALWLEHLGVKEKIVLCGGSMGGYVALEFARSYSDRLRALILVGTRADADSPEGKQTRTEMAQFAKQSSGAAVAEKMLPRLLAESTREGKPEVVARVKEIASANRGEDLASFMLAMRDRRDSTEILAGISVPTLAIGGREDMVSSPEVMAGMAAQLRGAKHVVVERAGHLVHLEQPETFNAAMRQFLEESA